MDSSAPSIEYELHRKHLQSDVAFTYSEEPFLAKVYVILKVL